MRRLPRHTLLVSAALLAAACGSLRMADLSDAGTSGPAVEDSGGPGRSDAPPSSDGGVMKEAGRPADGSSISTKGPVEIIASGFDRPYGVALTEDAVFFTLRRDSASQVRRVRKDGQQESVVVAAPDAAAGLSDLGDAVLIAGNEVVWLSAGASGGVFAAPLAGGPVRRVRSLEKPHELAHHAGVLYFSDEAFSPYGYALQRIQMDGGGLRLVDEYEIRVSGIAADPSGVYWTTAGALASGKALVRTQPLDAPDAASTRDLVVNTHRDEMGGIALTQDDVFWAETGQGRVFRIAKAGGSATVLAEGVAQPRRVAVDDTHVWFTTRTTIARVPRAGGPVEDFVTAVDDPIGLAVDATHVYWAAYGSGEIGRIRK